MVRSILRRVIALEAISFTAYFFYVRLYQKKKAKYPLAPLEGNADVYFPRTDIPRPVHADFRQLQEKKRKLEKTRKKLRTKKRR